MHVPIGIHLSGISKNIEIKAHVSNWNRAKKIRHYAIVDHVRNHLDEGEQLGRYLEFEIPVGASDKMDESRALAKQVMKKYRIPPKDLIDSSYIDLYERPVE